MYIAITVSMYQPIYNFLPTVVELNDTTRAVGSGLFGFFMAFLVVETFKVAAVIVLIISFIIILFVGISNDYTYTDLQKGVQTLASAISSLVESKASKK